MGWRLRSKVTGWGNLHRPALLALVTSATALSGFSCERLVLVTEHKIKLVRITRTRPAALLALAAYWTLLITLMLGQSHVNGLVWLEKARHAGLYEGRL